MMRGRHEPMRIGDVARRDALDRREASRVAESAFRIERSARAVESDPSPGERRGSPRRSSECRDKDGRECARFDGQQNDMCRQRAGPNVRGDYPARASARRGDDTGVPLADHATHLIVHGRAICRLRSWRDARADGMEPKVRALGRIGIATLMRRRLMAWRRRHSSDQGGRLAPVARIAIDLRADDTNQACATRSKKRSTKTRCAAVEGESTARRRCPDLPQLATRPRATSASARHISQCRT